MAAITASDVTYTIEKASIREDSFRVNRVKIVFGDSALTYPTGGVPLTIAKMGMPTYVESFNWIEDSAGDGYAYKYDDSAKKIFMYQSDLSESTDGPMVQVPNTVAPAATTLYAEVIGY